jgi:hypothetical protein
MGSLAATALTEPNDVCYIGWLFVKEVTHLVLDGDCCWETNRGSRLVFFDGKFRSSLNVIFLWPNLYSSLWSTSTATCVRHWPVTQFSCSCCHFPRNTGVQRLDPVSHTLSFSRAIDFLATFRHLSCSGYRDVSCEQRQLTIALRPFVLKSQSCCLKLEKWHENWGNKSQ